MYCCMYEDRWTEVRVRKLTALDRDRSSDIIEVIDDVFRINSEG